MNSFQTTIKILKANLSQKSKDKVCDKELAIALGMTPSVLAAMRKRNTLPRVRMLDLCVTGKIDASDLFFPGSITLEKQHRLVCGSEHK